MLEDVLGTALLVGPILLTMAAIVVWLLLGDVPR